MSYLQKQKSDVRFPLVAATAVYLIAFLILAWPWLSGVVTIPWDAKAQFQPELQFLARSFHQGQSPFWTPNVFAGWPQIADPQSLIFSPLHVLLAAVAPAPSFRAAAAAVFAVLDPQRLCRLAADRRSAVADFLAAPCAARRRRSGAELPRRGRGRIRGA